MYFLHSLLFSIFFIRNSLEYSIDSSELKNTNNCGIRKFDKNIKYDNYTARFGEFPWTVGLYYSKLIKDDTTYALRCGGSLIHPKIVLTGSLCAKLHNLIENGKIKIGSWNTNGTDDHPIQERNITGIYLYPNQTNLIGGIKDYDYALIELDSAVQLNDYVNTICLPSSDYESDSEYCFASGWGNSNFNQSPATVMKRLPLPIVPYLKCQTAIETLGARFQSIRKELEHSYVCSGGKGISTCQGDYGGPFVCPIPNAEDRYIQIGISAFGMRNCDGASPEFNSKVSVARQWIDSKFDDLGLDKSYYSFLN